MQRLSLHLCIAGVNKINSGAPFNFASVGMMSRNDAGDQWLDSWQCLTPRVFGRKPSQLGLAAQQV